jgi:hypothetical protein
LFRASDRIRSPGLGPARYSSRQRLPSGTFEFVHTLRQVPPGVVDFSSLGAFCPSFKLSAINPCASQELVSFFKSAGPQDPNQETSIALRINCLDPRGGCNVQKPCYDRCDTRDPVGGIAHVRSRASRSIGQRAHEIQQSELCRISAVDGLAHPPRHWYLGILFEQQ